MLHDQSLLARHSHIVWWRKDAYACNAGYGAYHHLVHVQVKVEHDEPDWWVGLVKTPLSDSACQSFMFLHVSKRGEVFGAVCDAVSNILYRC